MELKSAMQKHPKLEPELLNRLPAPLERRFRTGERSESPGRSGLKRVRCRATSDGVIGWATVVGNQGTVYLEVK